MDIGGLGEGPKAQRSALSRLSPCSPRVSTFALIRDWCNVTSDVYDRHTTSLTRGQPSGTFLTPVDALRMSPKNKPASSMRISS